MADKNGRGKRVSSGKKQEEGSRCYADAATVMRYYFRPPPVGLELPVRHRLGGGAGNLRERGGSHDQGED